MALKRAQLAGHRPVVVVGGATGRIGDPSGKTEERKLLELDDLRKNLEGIRAQVGRFLDYGDGKALLVDNFEWFSGIGYIEFLREIGKHFTVNMMLAKESVRARLEDREHGISYTEFSYMLMQAYDFLWLHDHHGCSLQIGASDQWGNITAGIELIRRLRQKEAFALTMPLLTTATGQKFGKTEKGAVWLDARRTSPFDFYQFFLRTDDREVGKLLRYLTLLDEQTIVALEASLARAPEGREAQRELAREVTRLVHGADEVQRAEAAARAFYENAEVDVSQLPHTKVPRARLPLLLVDSLVESGLCKSKSDARRSIEQGGVYVNEQRVDDLTRALDAADIGTKDEIVLRRGKRDKHILLFTAES
jgi:tyrosyl-tRNA synthetase